MPQTTATPRLGYLIHAACLEGRTLSLARLIAADDAMMAEYRADKAMRRVMFLDDDTTAEKG